MSAYNDMLFGCIPNAENPKLLSDLKSRFEVAWDAEDKPSLCSWESLKSHLEEKAETIQKLKSAGKYRFWWETCRKLGLNPEKLLVPSQGNIGSCAGVSYFDRCYLITVLHQIAEGSEQQIEPVNALVTWLISKGWSIRGGQTISAVVMEGIETGVFPASMVGNYSAGWYDKRTAQDHAADAEKRQMGACLVPDSEDKFDALTLALQGGKAVEIGNSKAVNGYDTDSNGVTVLTLGGSWSHATMFSEILDINGNPYYRWENTHDLICESEFGPRFGGLMTPDGTKRFLDCTFCDLAVVTYAESPYDTTIKPTLLPEI